MKNIFMVMIGLSLGTMLLASDARWGSTRIDPTAQWSLTPKQKAALRAREPKYSESRADQWKRWWSTQPTFRERFYGGLSSKAEQIRERARQERLAHEAMIQRAKQAGYQSIYSVPGQERFRAWRERTGENVAQWAQEQQKTPSERFVPEPEAEFGGVLSKPVKYKPHPPRIDWQEDPTFSYQAREYFSPLERAAAYRELRRERLGAYESLPQSYYQEPYRGPYHRLTGTPAPEWVYPSYWYGGKPNE